MEELEKIENRIRKVETKLRRLFDDISERFVAQDIELQAEALRKIADDLAEIKYRSKP